MEQIKQKTNYFMYAIIILLSSFMFMLSGCFTRYIPTIEDVAQELADDWGIQLPEDAKLLYYLHNSCFTDGETYCVIGFEKPPLLWDFSFGRDDSPIDLFYSILDHMSKDTRTEIPTEYLPDCEAGHCWREILYNKKADDLYLLYYPERLELYVLILDW